MTEWKMNASKMFQNATKFLEAYHVVLQPICKESGLPPMAVDILLFFSNNPDRDTARDVCQCRGWKPGIVSVHIERLVNEGLLERQEVPGDRRKNRLVCTDKAQPLICRARVLQKGFAEKLMSGLRQEQIAEFRNCLSVIDRNITEIRENGISAGETEGEETC